jgi:hypothetical protein
MFSAGQIKSKEWLVEELSKIDLDFMYKKIAVSGSWFGTLGMMLKCKFPTSSITMIDLDPRCETFIGNIIYDIDDMQAVTADMYTYRYFEDIIINTSCEHITDVKGWLALLPRNRIVVLQANDFTDDEDHINCVSDIDAFILLSGMTNVIYSGVLKFPMYNRFMIIGRI